MAKRKTTEKEPKQIKNELTTKKEKKEVLATVKDVEIGRWHIKSITFPRLQ